MALLLRLRVCQTLQPECLQYGNGNGASGLGASLAFASGRWPIQC